MDTDEVEQAVEQRRVWLQGQLNAAAVRFGVELVGEVVNTFDMRSAGAPAHDGERAVWPRVVVEDPDYQPACRWEGNVEANSRRVRAMPVLQTRTGQIALLFAICRYLWVIGEGSDLDQTEKHLRSEGSNLVSRLAH
ncbi:MAG: hypothetical protein JO272_05390 [Pseudonocardiales bacterium]|nr:hypothetical protein [Pseudonocardiales bacterium]